MACEGPAASAPPAAASSHPSPGRFTPPPDAARFDPQPAELLRALEEGARPAEALAATLGWPIGRVLAVLARLELDRTVQALPGGLFARGRGEAPASWAGPPR